MAKENSVSSISQSRTLEEMADSGTRMTPPTLMIGRMKSKWNSTFIRAAHYIAIDPDLLNRLRDTAATRGLSTESLANLWLQERLLKLAA